VRIELFRVYMGTLLIACCGSAAIAAFAAPLDEPYLSWWQYYVAFWRCWAAVFAALSAVGVSVATLAVWRAWRCSGRLRARPRIGGWVPWALASGVVLWAHADLYFWTIPPDFGLLGKDDVPRGIAVAAMIVGFPVNGMLVGSAALVSALFLIRNSLNRIGSASGCSHCGYDLTGAPSPTCPECGKPAS
jgi:hypothetical protein